MNKDKDIAAISELQTDRVLQATLSYKSISGDERAAAHKRLAEAYQAAFTNQPALNIEKAIESFPEDGVAADFINDINFPNFVKDLIKGVFDAKVQASIKQMDDFADLMKAAKMPVSKIAGKISDKDAIKYLDSTSSDDDDDDDGGKKIRIVAYSKAAIKSAKLALAEQQQRLIRQVVLIGIARLFVDQRIAKSKVFLGIKAEKDISDIRLREKIIRSLYGENIVRATEVSLTRSADPENTAVAAPVQTGELSGPVWVSRFPGSSSVNDLEPLFKNNVAKFIAALDEAKVTRVISATFRPPERAYLMHFSWRIAKGDITGEVVEQMPGVAIIWWHGNLEDTRAAAIAMVKGYHIETLKVPPSRKSRHIQRKAIDMTISWIGDLRIKDATGKIVTITSSPKDMTNPDLIKVGATYNVLHFQPPGADRVHWSTDGR